MKQKLRLVYSIKIVIFFTIIIVPVMFMNFKENQVSEIDNRMLTDYKDIFNEENSIGNFSCSFMYSMW